MNGLYIEKGPNKYFFDEDKNIVCFLTMHVYICVCTLQVKFLVTYDMHFLTTYLHILFI